MYWVQYLQKDLNGKVIDAFGTDAVFILDGRNNITTMHYDALRQAARLQRVHHYYGYTICKGESFTREARRTEVTKLTYPISNLI